MTDLLKMTQQPAEPSALEVRFPVGCLVRLRESPDGPPGRVTGYEATRVTVNWPAPLAYRGVHRACTLTLEREQA